MVAPNDVKRILDTELGDDDIQAYISSANVLIDNTLSDTPSSLKEVIVLWLTAHMIASTREQQISEAGAGPARVKFQGKTGLGLDSTQYGQQVKVLDTSGKLASLGRVRAELFAIRSFS